MTMTRGRTTVAATVAALALLAGTVGAKPLFIKKAQEGGHKDVKSCTYCHTDKKPVKELNPVGLWLQKQKETKKAQEVDPTWLKDYTPSK